METIPSPFRDNPHTPPQGLGGMAAETGEAGGEALRNALHSELRIDPNRERLRSGQAVIDPFDIRDIMDKYAPTRGDPMRGNVQNEIDFNWKRHETYGKPDFAEQRTYHQQGWRPVQHHHFPGRFAPEGTDGPVLVKDMILMERPMRLTVQARNEEILEATRAMQVHRKKIAETPEGSAQRIVYANRDSREAISIPND